MGDLTLLCVLPGAGADSLLYYLPHIWPSLHKAGDTVEYGSGPHKCSFVIYSLEFNQQRPSGQGLGEGCQLGKAPKIGFHHIYLGTGWHWPRAMLHWPWTLSRTRHSGLLTLSPGLTGLPPLSPTGRLSCRRGPGCSSPCKASCAWQPLGWPCR